MLGAAAAQLLGIDRVFPGERIWAGNMWLYVAGILKPDVLSPDVDSSVLVGYPFAEQYYGFDGHPTTIYVKATDSPGERGGQPARRAGRPGGPEQRRTSRSPRPRWSPRPTPRARSTPCSSAWARSRCWSARSGWPTSWSSPCWNGAARSACAGRSARPAATSGSSSCPKRSRWPWPAAPPGSPPGRRPPPIYAHTKGWAVVIPAAGLGGRAGRRGAHRRPGRAAARAQSRPAVSHRSAVDAIAPRWPVGADNPITGAGRVPAAGRVVERPAQYEGGKRRPTCPLIPSAPTPTTGSTGRVPDRQGYANSRSEHPP